MPQAVIFMTCPHSPPKTQKPQPAPFASTPAASLWEGEDIVGFEPTREGGFSVGQPRAGIFIITTIPCRRTAWPIGYVLGERERDIQNLLTAPGQNWGTKT